MNFIFEWQNNDRCCSFNGRTMQVDHLISERKKKRKHEANEMNATLTKEEIKMSVPGILSCYSVSIVMEIAVRRIFNSVITLLLFFASLFNPLRKYVCNRTTLSVKTNVKTIGMDLWTITDSKY